MSALEQRPEAKAPVHRGMGITAGMGKPATITQEQIDRFLELVRENPTIGNVAALRQIGVQGNKRELRLLLDTDDDLDLAVREARGWSLEAAENVLYKVAMDPSHPSWDRANHRFLSAHSRRYWDRQVVDQRLEVSSPDVSDAVDRLSEILSAAAVRNARPEGPADVAGELVEGRDGGAGVQVAGVVRAAGSAPAGG